MTKCYAVYAACSLIGLPLAMAQAPLGLSASNDGHLIAQNLGTATVTAFAVVYGSPAPAATKGAAGVEGWQLYDAATEPLVAKPIAAGRQVTVQCHFNCAATAYHLQVVIMQDGTAWGDSAWAQRISTRRTYMAQALQTSIRDLAAALIQGTPRAALIAQFQGSLDRETSAAMDGDLKGCIKSTRGAVLMNLQRVIQRPDGSAIPVNDVIQHAMTSLQARLASVVFYGGQQ